MVLVLLEVYDDDNDHDQDGGEHSKQLSKLALLDRVNLCPEYVLNCVTIVCGASPLC